MRAPRTTEIPRLSSGPSRRTFLGGATAGALLAGVGGVGLSSSARAVETLPLTVTNDSGRYPDDAVFVHVVGTELTTNVQGRVNGDGVFQPASLADNGSDGNASYGIPLSTRRVTPLPEMSGRIYVSLGQQLPFRVVGTADGVGIAHPAGWVDDDPSFDILYDVGEFTHLDGAMYCNTSMVDMWSVPLSITLVGDSTQRAGEVEPGGRSRFFDAIAAQDGFSSLVVDDRRVIAPSHGIGVGRFDGSYLDAYIDEAWNRWRTSRFTITAGVETYTAGVEGEEMVAYQGDNRVAAYGKPSTSDVLFCNGTLVSPNDGVSGPIGAILGAALNRTTLTTLDAQPGTDPATFYQEPRTNHYARILHEVHTDGRAYGFAYDDVAGFASYIQDQNPRSVELIIDRL